MSTKKLKMLQINTNSPQTVNLNSKPQKNYCTMNNCEAYINQVIPGKQFKSQTDYTQTCSTK